MEIQQIELELVQGKSNKLWKCSGQLKYSSVENAALSSFSKEGWRGFSGEGALVLSLIKAMSFPVLPERHKGTYIEAIYAQNVAFEEDKYERAWLLNNVANASTRQVRKNFRIMFEDSPGFIGRVFSELVPRVGDPPRLKEWMLLGLLNALGRKKIHEIAEQFARDPYQYRKGWPDLTIWRKGEARFLEVKAPGDRLRSSQLQVFRDIAKPLHLSFAVVSVVARG